MSRAVLGVLAGLLLWSVLWFSLNWILPVIVPSQFRADGTSDNFVLNLIIVLLSFDFSFISGYINAIIARVHQLRAVFIQGVIQLSVGVYVQQQYWDFAPLWFHLTFLGLMIPGLLAGALYHRANENEGLDEKNNS